MLREVALGRRLQLLSMGPARNALPWPCDIEAEEIEELHATGAHSAGLKSLPESDVPQLSRQSHLFSFERAATRFDRFAC